MLVVADTSPLIVLSKIDLMHVLPALFGTVFVPSSILAELGVPGHADQVRQLVDSRPAWLIVKDPVRILPIPGLDVGESAAISLALEEKADLLLIDEMIGRTAARQCGLDIAGAIGVLEMAAAAKVVDLADAFGRVKRTDFWIPHAFLDERLRLFRQSGGA